METDRPDAVRHGQFPVMCPDITSACYSTHGTPKGCAAVPGACNILPGLRKLGRCSIMYGRKNGGAIMSKKKRLHGHYCKICGEYKANEKFSGKGHANYICKACAKLSAAEKSEAMTINRLMNLSMKRLSDSEKKWLENCTHDKRPDVAGMAKDIYRMRFPYAERNAIKKQLAIHSFIFEVNTEVWDGYDGWERVHQRISVNRSERKITMQDFEREEPEQSVMLDGSQMSKLRNSPGTRCF